MEISQDFSRCTIVLDFEGQEENIYHNLRYKEKMEMVSFVLIFEIKCQVVKIILAKVNFCLFA